MELVPGVRLSHYEILEKIGAGGMGEVYRARDTRLDRIVAIKVLPQHLSQDSNLRQRLEREARTISTLNHPHICTLYDVGHQEGIDYLVMEHLEGESLAERLEKGALSTEEGLQFAIQIADALDKAHRKNVIHRDLKPGNIMIVDSGAKLLDFGLAKVEVGGETSELSATPTAVSPLTSEGAIVGTYQYMAPEQLEGKPADARSDIFAFGTVVHEMFTGKKAFEGKTQASLIASILKEEPRPLSAVTPMTPPALEQLVRTCLAKDPEERRQSMHDVLLELRWIAEGGSVAERPPALAAPRKGRERLAWGVAALAVAGVLSLMGAWAFWGKGTAPGRIYQSNILAPEEAGGFFALNDIDSGSLTVSPDGQYVTFAARTAEGKQALWTRTLDTLDARPVPGTDGGKHPFWSPDSRFLAFFADGKLKKVDLAGSPALTLCNAPNGRSGSWNKAGVILFSPSTLDPIYKVPAGGGTPEPVSVLDKDRHETTHRWATFLPDGRHFLYMAGGHGSDLESETHAIYVGDLESEGRRLLFHARSNVHYASGYLLYSRDRVLLAHPFDPETRQLTGDPIPIAEEVQYVPGFFRTVFGVSDNGILVYREDVGVVKSKLTWIDRKGNSMRSLGEADFFDGVSLAPDENRAAVTIQDFERGTSNIWIYDLTREVSTRFTFGTLSEFGPVWSPDGRQIIYSAITEVWPDLYIKQASGAGEATLLLQEDSAKVATSWSPDGNYLVFDSDVPQGDSSTDIFILPLTGERKPYPFVQTEFDESGAVFSPDGKWLAYTSDESGRPEIYVTPFPGPGGKWQISKGGGSNSEWTKEGSEILYVSGDGKVMSVGIESEGDSIEAGAPVALFATDRLGAADVSRDGERALIAVRPEEIRHHPLTLVVNWPELVK